MGAGVNAMSSGRSIFDILSDDSLPPPPAKTATIPKPIPKPVPKPVRKPVPKPKTQAQTQVVEPVNYPDVVVPGIWGGGWSEFLRG
jgi:hypothetical protein